MGEGDGDLAHGFVGGDLARHAEEVVRTTGVVADAELEGAVGFFRLMEKLCLGLAALQGGKALADVAKVPLDGDLVFPVELFLARLIGGIDKQRRFGAVEAEADHSAGRARVWLVDRVVGGELRTARVGILRGRSLRVGGGAAVSGAAAVAGNAPLRVFRYASASPFRLNRY